MTNATAPATVAAAVAAPVATAPATVAAPVATAPATVAAAVVAAPFAAAVVAAPFAAASKRLEGASPVAVAAINLDCLSPSSLADHREAVEFFRNGGTISKAAASYAVAADTYFHRALVWIVASGFARLPANDKGKAPSIKAEMEKISSDSKNAARAMAQEVYALAWKLNEKGLDPLAFASLRAMRDAGRAKDKVIPNDSTAATIASDAPASDASDAASDAPKHEVAAADLAVLMEERAVLALLCAELAKSKPSIPAMRAMVQKGLVTAAA